VTALLEVDGLSHAFGGIRVAHGIQLRIERGDRVALIGPNGAGKTSLVDLVCGRWRPQSGRIRLEGRDIVGLSDVKRVQAGIVRSFQISRLFKEMTVGQHLALAIMAQRKRLNGWLIDIAQTPQLKADIAQACKTLGLENFIDHPVAQLAYGTQRLLEIAIALALTPKLLILDEPAAGIANADLPTVLRVLKRLPPDLAVLMIEHDMDLVFRFAQRVIVLVNGRIVCEGTPGEVAADARVRHAYLGDRGARR
jgi:branched-chain amino acid transport system ATP-binding protein